MITFTDKGAEKVQEFLASQSADIETSGLRVGVRDLVDILRLGLFRLGRLAGAGGRREGQADDTQEQ